MSIRFRLFGGAIATIAMVFMVCPAHAQTPGPALTVDVTADRHPISPDIYGIAYAEAAFLKEIRPPMNRWGGDATTRYNWKVDATNAGDDWFFMAGGNAHPTPSGGPDALVAQAKAGGGRALITVPIFDFINSKAANDCSFPVSLFGPQQKVNPYNHPTINGKQTDAGNGRKPDGKPLVLTPEQILRIHVPNTPEFQRGWIEHLVRKFGPTAKGGVAAYELDNEPGGWNNTHRDIHPGATGHDELVSRSIAYAAMIKSVDPTALVAGPGDFVMHYQGDGKPGDGSKEHGGIGQGNYYLQQMRQYEKQHKGGRILDYFDEHYYAAEQDGQTADTILECTRSLWDPTYVEKNWIGKWSGAKELIPKFRRWVDQYYPGTKISISEYGWGDTKTLLGTLALADVLGIFGRERLDMACMWGPPKASEPATNAFRLYLSYDGHGSRYGDVWVKSASKDQGRLSIYGAQRTTDHALTLIVINKSHADLSSALQLSHFKPAATAKVFRFSKANLKALVAEPDQQIGPTGFSATFPAQSMTLFVVSRR